MTSHQHVVVGVLIAEEAYVLVQQRTQTSHLEGYWEFPGGKVEDRESILDALVREFREETELELSKSLFEQFETIHHNFPDRTVKLEFYLGRVRDRLPVRTGAIWYPLARLGELTMPDPNGPIVDKLLRLPVGLDPDKQ